MRTEGSPAVITPTGPASPRPRVQVSVDLLDQPGGRTPDKAGATATAGPAALGGGGSPARCRRWRARGRRSPPGRQRRVPGYRRGLHADDGADDARHGPAGGRVRLGQVLLEVIATNAEAAPNVSQIENWDGPGGQHWVAEAERYDRMTRSFGAQIIEAAAPRPGERVLDVGCGNGAVALAVSDLVAPSGSRAGLDIPGPRLAYARRRAEAAGIASVSFCKGDAQVYPLPQASFDAVVSRFGVMFFDDPVAAFANIGRALRPGGRLVFTCWRDLMVNDWLMVPAAAALQHVPMPDLGQ